MCLDDSVTHVVGTYRAVSRRAALEGRDLVASLLACALALPVTAASAQCAADLNGDRKVNGADIDVLFGQWGTAGGATGADIDGNGTVSGTDLGVIIGEWGDCPVTVPSWAALLQAQPDPAVVKDPALRAAIEAAGLAWRVRDTATQIEMLLVPPGTFQMGCIMGSNQSGCPAGELPVHQVTLTNAFYLGRYEVTQAQWTARMGSNPSNFKSASMQVPSTQVPSRPVEQVSWLAVQGFLGATGMRLPTEAEWEFACRAGTQTPFHNGSTDVGTVGVIAWYFANSSGQTRPVGGKAANAFGFHDMVGNVEEWVNDWYAGYSAAAQTNPTGPAGGEDRMIRGGSWLSGTGGQSSSLRFGRLPGFWNDRLGFRVARNP